MSSPKGNQVGHASRYKTGLRSEPNRNRNQAYFTPPGPRLYVNLFVVSCTGSRLPGLPFGQDTGLAH